MHRAERGEFACELRGALRVAVGDLEVLRIGLQERAEHAAGGAARAEQQHARAAEVEREIARQVGDEAGSIGVVAEHAVVTQRQRIHRAGHFGARRALTRDQARRLLVRQRDVQPFAIGGEEFDDPVVERFGRDFQA